jgi:hypothetical protein
LGAFQKVIEYPLALIGAHIRFPLPDTPYRNDILKLWGFCSVSTQLGRMFESGFGILQELLDLLIAKDFGLFWRAQYSFVACFLQRHGGGKLGPENEEHTISFTAVG